MSHRLLVVDSDRRFLQDHQASLEATFDAEFRDTTEGALGRLESGDFCAILLSVEASENKGYSLCSAIRRNPAMAGLKVALISAKATEEEYARHQSLKGRADLYLHKPIRPNALISALGPIMPVKAMDPDNPLGDLGDEWLESLRNELEIDTVIQDPQVPLAHQATQQLPVIAEDGGRVELETRIRDLEAQLKAKTRTAVELDALLNAANEQLEEDAQELGRLRHQGEAAQGLVEEKDRLIQDLETRLAAAGEHQQPEDRELPFETSVASDLMDSYQQLQVQAAEQRTELERLTRSEQALVARNLDLESERNESLGAREVLENSLADLHRQLSLLEGAQDRTQMELLAAIDARDARVAELDAALAAQTEKALLLQQEKETAATRIQVRSDRLLALSERLEELEQQARTTLELAKAEID